MMKLIGGNSHGRTTRDKFRVIAMNTPAPLASFEFDPNVPTLPETTEQFREVYTRRFVEIDGETIYFYAPEAWSTAKALRFVLT